MPFYECVLIARNDVTQQQVEGLADGIAAQLEGEGGAIQKREYWGLRSLAYRIKKNRKGHYMLLGLDAKPADDDALSTGSSTPTALSSKLRSNSHGSSTMQRHSKIGLREARKGLYIDL